MHSDLKHREIEQLQMRIAGIKKLRLFVSVILTICVGGIVTAVIASSSKSDKVLLYVLCLGLVLLNGVVTYITFSLAIKSAAKMENTLKDIPADTETLSQNSAKAETFDDIDK